jgi:hypothetical protein
MAMLNYLGDKVDVISNSWSSGPQCLLAPIVIRKISELALHGGRRGKGLLFVWSAGIRNCPVNYDSPSEIPYIADCRHVSLDGIKIGSARSFRNPVAGLPGVLHVAALTSSAQRFRFSNYGTGVDLCASYANLNLNGCQHSTGQKAHTGSGSNATAITAAVAALVISANPGLSAVDIASVLKQTASKDLVFEAPGSVEQKHILSALPLAPFDSGNFRFTGDRDGTWSPWFGQGRVDAGSAVAEALRRRSWFV